MSGQTILPDLLSNISVVLFEPQDDINIGNTVRACKNFGVRSIRLVNPASGDARRISISAPRAEDVIDNLERFDDLESALADCTFVLATSARERRNKRLYLEPRGAAAELVQMASKGRVAVLFGREDSGLPNFALDRANAIVTIPTDPEYSSLNLGQAVLLVMYEIFRVSTDAPIKRAPEHIVRASSESPLAELAAIDRMVGHAESVLTKVGFLKEQSREHMMSTLREMYMRTGLDEREVSIWHGIFAQIQWGLKNPEKLVEESPPQ